MKLTRRHALTLATAGASTIAMPYVKRARAEDKVVNVYNWVEYIGETTLEDFKSATGIEVVYDTYDSAETVEAKVMAGSSGYDVIDISSLNLPRFLPGGSDKSAFQKLDRSKLPNIVNLDPVIMKLLADRDPGNEFSIPYMWGTTGLTVNLDMVKERVPNAPVDSMDLIMKPEYMEKLADCGVNILESPTDAIPMALAWLGKDPNSESPEDLEAAVKAFEPVRQYIKTFDAANYLNALPNSELCVSMTWSGDYATSKTRAEEAGLNLNLAYNVPKTGAGLWVDVFTVPVDAPHPENAHAFLNYMMDAEVAAKCVNYTNYASGVLAARKFIDKKVLEDVAVYPSDDIMKRLWVQKTASQDYERLRTEAWSRIKTGS
ncbi:MAG: polyamine ABC transporter substrate-binding protein [Rhizobiales bacterium]|nr:polyamine ABC transporter substrate-binding protein [Hyphomicrobiales bacterium]